MESVKGCRKYFYWGSQKIGLITNIRRNNTEREVDCTIYNVKGSGAIYISERDGAVKGIVKVELIKGNSIKELEPLPNTKSYLETNLRFVQENDDQRTTIEILDLIEGGEGEEGELEDGGKGITLIRPEEKYKGATSNWFGIANSTKHDFKVKAYSERARQKGRKNINLKPL